jgi:integrase
VVLEPLMRNVTARQKKAGQAAVEAAGITKRVCYRTFRHTFGTLLNASGENPKVVQELLRHATLKVTTDTYMQALSSDKRQAQAKLITMVRGIKSVSLMLSGPTWTMKQNRQKPVSC